MVNLWRKYKEATKRKKEALHSLIAGLILFAVFYFITRFFSVTLCPIRRFLGISCFGCGLTRGVISVLSFNLAAATEHHVLSIPIFVGGLIYAVLCFSDILFYINDLERLSRIFGKKYMLVLYLIVLTLSAYLNYII